MRDIKFRAWDETNDRMVKAEGGSLAQSNGYLSLEVGYTGFRDDDGEYRYAEVGHIKLMQYTGLKDKNGVEIYCSDKLLHRGIYRTVRWIEGRACWNAGSLRLTEQLAEKSTVEGNVYED